MLNVMPGSWSRVLPASLFTLLVAGCTLEPAIDGEETPGAADQPSGDEEVASLTSPVYCVANWVRVQPAFTSCYIDKDTHFLYVTMEVYGADLYRDVNGCFPDAYKIRRLDRIRCPGLSSCSLGRWSQEPLVPDKVLIGSNYCPRPRVEDFPPSTGEPPPPPVCQSTPINIGMTCNESWCNESFGRACSAAGGQTGVEPGGWLVCQRVVCN
jgi:hypothetical protein